MQCHHWKMKGKGGSIDQNDEAHIFGQVQVVLADMQNRLDQVLGHGGEAGL